MWGILAIVVLATAIFLAFAIGALRSRRQAARWERVLSELQESRRVSPATATRSVPDTPPQIRRHAPRPTEHPETAPARPPPYRKRKIEVVMRPKPEVTAGAAELAAGIHAIELRQRLVGGGEVVRGYVRLEGGRVVWKFEEIDAAIAYALQRDVVVHSGVWPGAGEAYLAAVLAVFPRDDPASRWYAVQQHQQVA